MAYIFKSPGSIHFQITGDILSYIHVTKKKKEEQMHHTHDKMQKPACQRLVWPAIVALLLVLGPLARAATVTMVYTGMPYDYDLYDIYPPDARNTWEISFDDSALSDNMLTNNEMISWQGSSVAVTPASERCGNETKCSATMTLTFLPGTLELTSYSLDASDSFFSMSTRSVSFEILPGVDVYDYATGPMPEAASTAPGSWQVVPIPGAVWLLGSGLLGLVGVRSFGGVGSAVELI